MGTLAPSTEPRPLLLCADPSGSHRGAQGPGPPARSLRAIADFSSCVVDCGGGGAADSPGRGGTTGRKLRGAKPEGTTRNTQLSNKTVKRTYIGTGRVVGQIGASLRLHVDRPAVGTQTGTPAARCGISASACQALFCPLAHCFTARTPQALGVTQSLRHGPQARNCPRAPGAPRGRSVARNGPRGRPLVPWRRRD